jgi:hypothetical protein
MASILRIHFYHTLGIEQLLLYLDQTIANLCMIEAAHKEKQMKR